MANEYADRDFLEFIIKSIVDHPEDVKVERKIDEMGVLLTLKVNPQDMGQVIGRKGSTSTAIRSLLRIVGIKNNARVNLKIEEPEGGRQGERRSFGEVEKESGEPERGTIDKVIDDIKNL
ncbi:MAG: KH domain-containing protein [bacterium]|nr:KH domain-containing protein [bacterium]